MFTEYEAKIPTEGVVFPVDEAIWNAGKCLKLIYELRLD